MEKQDIHNKMLRLLDKAAERRSLDLAGVEKIIGIKFPKGTNLIKAEHFSWLEPYLYVKLRMSESAYKQFTSLPQFAGTFSSTDRRGIRNALPFTERGMSWWNPDDVTGFLAAETTILNGTRGWTWEQTLVLISTAPDLDNMHVAYLYWTANRH